MLSNLAFLAATRLPLTRLPFTRPRRTLAHAVLRPNVAIVGGGHAGLSVALRLTTLPWTRLTRPSITLIDPKSRFIFLPMLYELALSQVEQWEVAPTYQTLLSDTSINFVQAAAENIDFSSRVIEGTRKDADHHREMHVPFDRLVLAVGAQPAGIDRVPGAREFAVPFYELGDADKLRERVETMRKGKGMSEVCNVVIVGGGYSGVELASCLAETLGSAGSVMIVESGERILKSGTDFNRQSAEKALVANGAVVLYETRVVEIRKDEVTVKKGEDVERYPADMVVWTAGSRPNEALRSFDVPLDERGRVVTDELLQVKGFEDLVYALGDAAAVEGYYGTAQVAVQQAEYVAWNCWASLMGKPLLEYRYAHLGEMMVLGGRNATVTTSVGVEVDGGGGWAMRRLAYLARMPTERHRGRVAASWAVHPLLSGMGDLVRESRKYRTNNV